MLRTIGIILIVLGIVAFVFQGITYTTREKVIDLGPIQATAEKKNTIPLPPVLGGFRLLAESYYWLRAAKRAKYCL